MKKFFALMLIAGSLVACNNASDTDDTEDTTTMQPAPVPPIDTTGLNDTMNTIPDTTTGMQN